MAKKYGESEREREMVKFRSLYNDPENRNIVEIVQTATGAITVYEATQDDIKAIMALDDAVAALNQEVGEEGNTITIHSAAILQEIIPRLTDLDLDGMSDEELEKVIENLNAEGSVVMALLEREISRIYTLMILNFANQQLLNNLVDASENLTDQTLGMYIKQASQTDDGRKQIHELNKQANKLASAQKAQGQTETATEDNDVDDGVSYKDATVLDPEVDTKATKEIISGHFSDLSA